MQVNIFALGPIGTNGYLLTNDNRKAVFFDPGAPSDQLKDIITQQNLSVQGILLTHAHFDHIGGVEDLRKFTNAPVYIHPQERDWLSNPERNGSANPMWSKFISPIVCKEADGFIDQEGKFTIGDFTFDVFHTPGHSPGSLSYYIDGMVFSGDALFQGSIGRTDLYGGDFATLIASIQNKLFALAEETIVYPGHGDPTTIGQEKRFNPFLQP